MLNMGKKLKNLRIQRNLTQKQVAERVGVAISAISSYESELRYPSYAILIKLATTYHVSTDYLLGMPTGYSIDVSDLAEEDIALLLQMIERLKSGKKQ